MPLIPFQLFSNIPKGKLTMHEVDAALDKSRFEAYEKGKFDSIQRS